MSIKHIIVCSLFHEGWKQMYIKTCRSFYKKQIIFADITIVAHGLLHYLNTRWRVNPHHKINYRFHYQEAIQFQAAENVIEKDHGLGSNHGTPDLQTDSLAVELSNSLILMERTGYKLHGL